MKSFTLGLCFIFSSSLFASILESEAICKGTQTGNNGEPVEIKVFAMVNSLNWCLEEDELNKFDRRTVILIKYQNADPEDPMSDIPLVVLAQSISPPFNKTTILKSTDLKNSNIVLEYKIQQTPSFGNAILNFDKEIIELQCSFPAFHIDCESN